MQFYPESYSKKKLVISCLMSIIHFLFLNSTQICFKYLPRPLQLNDFIRF